jgi:hypothetical protein
MIKSTHLTTTGDTEVFRSTSTGDNTGTVQDMAVVCIIVCNTGAPDPLLIDETINQSTLTLNLSTTGTSSTTNTIVKNLMVPAGETVFFSDEKIILAGDNQIRATASAANLLSITVSALPV